MDSWTNERGNSIVQGWRDGDRYYFDMNVCTPEKGWEQYDTTQDAWYFGVWVHIKDRKVLTYAEGDVTVVECPTIESFRAELESMAEFYGDPPPAFVAYGQNESGEWTRTECYDTRPSV